LDAVRKRGEIVYGPEEARSQAAELASQYAERGMDCIIFSMRKEHARDVSGRLDERGVGSMQIHGNVEINSGSVLRPLIERVLERATAAMS
jgi:superfamily II DNA/RNA helicase